MANSVRFLEYLDDKARTLVYRLPPQGTIRLAENARLSVSDFQQAVFFRGGHPADTFGPGVYTLDESTLPKLMTLSDDDKPPATCAYFLGMQVFLHQKWGSKPQILLQDQQFGEVRLRSLGSYAFQIAEPNRFLTEFVEAKACFTTESVTAALHERIVATFSQQLRSATTKLFDLPRLFDDISQATRRALETDFHNWGLTLVDFFVNSISLPAHIQAAVDKSHGQMTFTDLRSFTLAQAATIHSLQNEPPTQPDRVKQRVRSVVKTAGWSCGEEDDGCWRVTVPIGSLRKQTVRIDFSSQDTEGHNLISFTSMCGPVSPDAAMSLLKHNVQMVYGAFAIQSSDSGEMLVVQGNKLADTADKLEITRILSAVAWQADQAEEKLFGGDQY